MEDLLKSLGPEIDDPEEEMFLLFSQEIPSQNLGFVDSRASKLDLTIAGRDYVIHQSPTVLSSNRAGGTTGAVLWKITPLFAEWIVSPENHVWKSGHLNSSSNVVELGCGISGLVGLVLAPSINRYVLTDQSYVSKYVESNLEENKNTAAIPSSNSGSRRKTKAKPPPPTTTSSASQKSSNISFAPLDWELDQVTSNLSGTDDVKSFDVVVACDCIYNDALIRPLVQTCVDVCKLRDNMSGSGDGDEAAVPAICIVAQQLRDPEIFEGWMKEFHKHFRSWRVPSEALTPALRSHPGFVIHMGILR